MRSMGHLRLRSGWHSLFATCLLLAPLPAAALSIPLEVEFDTGQTGSFGTVEVTENAGALDFVLTLDPAESGEDADLHVFYFNLVDEIEAIEITNTNAPVTEYRLEIDPSVRGGAGSDFEYGVHFGNGAGDKGNGVLREARFTITADVPLTIDSLIQSSFAQGGSIEVDLALHVQGTSVFEGSDSETFGAVVPEPATASMIGLGIAALALRAKGLPLRRRA